ncbi:MAG: hypothetical protein Q4F85_10220 [Prevotella sp.]|nr:hypothetical protein [Prevotella sp.]
MEKKENSQLKSNVISGISSTAGAVAGVVGGSMVTAEVNAAEMPEVTAEEQEVEVVSAEPSRTSGNQSHHEEQPAVEQPEPVNPEPQKPDPVAPEPSLVTPEPIDGDEIQVLSYDTITDNDGNEMDVAVVSASGQEIIIADVDQNGTADLMASDLNSNGQLEENEIVDVSEDNIAMQPLEEAANANDDMIAQTDDIDYVNNADVNDYMA